MLGMQLRAETFPAWQSAFSLEALRQAWLAIRANKGRGGSDGVTMAHFEQHLALNIQALREELLQGTYRPQRVTQVLVPKPSGGWRPLTLWAIRDRVAQRAATNYLEPVLDRRFLPCSFGFRPGLSTRDAADAIQAARQAGATWVLDADIEDCFGRMQNGRLLKQLRRWRVPGPMRALIERWLRAEVWNAWPGGAAAAGTSQGGVISPLLSNLYLHPFDEFWQRQRGLRLVRYADDFVILAPTEKAAQHARRLAERSLAQLGLTLHPHKTRITRFEAGFQFVGWFFVRDEMYQLK